VESELTEWRALTAMSTFNLKDHELGIAEVHHNLPPSSLAERARKPQLPQS
jgi:hypothetical protein